jgi:hypothetical protein
VLVDPADEAEARQLIADAQAGDTPA